MNGAMISHQNSLPMAMSPHFTGEEGPSAFMQQRVSPLMMQTQQQIGTHHPSQPYPAAVMNGNSFTSSLPSPLASTPSPIAMSNMNNQHPNSNYMAFSNEVIFTLQC